ncbi:DUF262 domain-containing protein [Methylobacterium sp. WL8]|uniref:DUF262 domain-containing protein n=1 Tax=Methylobacterium sp. WL8 TaxID=2603899 RepID=UPI0011CB41AB|nr:DUF262 domain-containing protein [Methylobacterium sp. WL8]TXN82689.1 DUF262 domain-containing protein [Methylobacterium sp. WL8]
MTTASLLSVDALFGDINASYTIPIYQRNYAWDAEQIEQLINDVSDAMHNGDESYFLGNLIVTERGSHLTDYEVIDGQQRLTTLYLLLTFFFQVWGHEIPGGYRDRLQYQSRPKSSYALRRITIKQLGRAGPTADTADDEDQRIYRGYNIISQFMLQKIQGDDRTRFAAYLRNHVNLVRAVLPKKTDLNRYFEIMNTRGQQLQQVDIVKARLMGLLSTDEQACFAWVWEACADMDSYVQMTLTRENPQLRARLFGEDWAWLRSDSSFGELLEVHRVGNYNANEANSVEFSDKWLTLDAALLKYAAAGAPSLSEDEDNARFRSTIEFPTLLLHTLSVWQEDGDADDAGLDDKKLIYRFSNAFDPKITDGVTLRSKAHQFLVLLLRCRNYFDAYVLKRQFTATNLDEGDWSVKRLVRGNKNSPQYINTAASAAIEVEDDCEEDSTTNDLLLIESMLRVTYTSPRTMHWITLVLRTVNAHHSAHSAESVVWRIHNELREYAREEVRSHLSASGNPKQGFDISRIVFTYVDYLLATASRKRDFRFIFRNSIEHFYPQSPDTELQAAYGVLESRADCDLFGNLVLITAPDNSKFTNSLPSTKANYDRIVAQSPKLSEMAEIAKNHTWDSSAIKSYHNKMVDLLRADIGICERRTHKSAIESAQCEIS